MSLRTPVFKTGAIAILPTLQHRFLQEEISPAHGVCTIPVNGYDAREGNWRALRLPAGAGRGRDPDARAIFDGPDRVFGEWHKVKPRGAAEPVAIIRQIWTQRLQALIGADGGRGVPVLHAR
jgi:hypothetical protein